jgi:NAD(P)-binding Rossmann-like domain
MIGGAVGIGGVAVASQYYRSNKMAGSLDGVNMARGHRLRDGGFPAHSREEQAGIIIAGGGVAGLTAGWMLTEAGFKDFQILELEDRFGGNARSGQNAISSYPLGAHYLTIPNQEAIALHHMLKKLGMIIGEKDGAPLYDPYQLSADLQERLFWRGKWQEGLYPITGLTAKDQADRIKFDNLMAQFSKLRGNDGRLAFAIPMAYSSRDPKIWAFDKLTFTQWLDREDLSSPILRRYLRYCCRDDYGTEPSDISAWAGIHYFAGRRGWAADGAGDSELTWPEGNGRLTGLMAQQLRDHLRPARTVVRVERHKDGAFADSFDHHKNITIRTFASAIILSTPHFITNRIVSEPQPTDGFSYAPWIVANVSVDQLPTGKGAKLAWDNVSSASESLGYVVSSHQSKSNAYGHAVLTWYLPLSNMPPAKARQLMIDRPLADWQSMVYADITDLHPELQSRISRIDVWRWGHAMVRPVPGFMSSIAPMAVDSVKPPLFPAHSDYSGLSLFEEAHYRGTFAAEAAMRHLGHAFTSLI